MCNLKHFSLAVEENSFTKAFFFRVLKKILYTKVTKDFSLTNKADSHNSVVFTTKDAALNNGVKICILKYLWKKTEFESNK